MPAFCRAEAPRPSPSGARRPASCSSGRSRFVEAGAVESEGEFELLALAHKDRASRAEANYPSAGRSRNGLWLLNKLFATGDVYGTFPKTCLMKSAIESAAARSGASTSRRVTREVAAKVALKRVIIDEVKHNCRGALHH